MSLNSYHIYLFPFQWSKKESKDKEFSKRFSLDGIATAIDSQWENIVEPKNHDYKVELYNEKNFFYKFVHKALYDSGIKEKATVKHFERKEAYEQDVVYEIGVKAGYKSTYRLKLNSIGLDVFSTGTGILMFYLENSEYSKIEDVRRINQYGRRVFPPFIGADNYEETTKGAELADYICIKGLNGGESRYFEDFSQVSKSMQPWGTAKFIKSLLDDFNPKLEIEPVVDDRMFTMCWYFDNNHGNRISDNKEFYKFLRSDAWHQYLYIDSSYSTCQNDRMQKELLEKNTYTRWQKFGTLYGITKKSFMVMSHDGNIPKKVLLTYFRTTYVRIVELALIQRASILKFSAEVANLSSLAENNKQKLADRIGDFYKSYIRFVNQIFFREITAQDQGIELYDLLLENLRTQEQVKDLDTEIGELHNYATLLDEKEQNRNLSLLTILGSLFLVPSFIVGYFGMNFFGKDDIKLSEDGLPFILAIILLLAGGLFGVVKLNKNKPKIWLKILIGFIALLILGVIIFPLIF